MNTPLTNRIKLFESPTNNHLLQGIRHGIERESLRVTLNGELTQTPHPIALGRSLTHPYITTDFSENLLEFITPVHQKLSHTLQFLNELHTITNNTLIDEYLWPASMPAYIGSEKKIPIAYYGQSNIGKLKSTYRQGLTLRYGKAMQTISGIHYNFSIPLNIWQTINQHEKIRINPKDLQSEKYLGLIRNFRRYSWLLMYCFGASPTMSKSFFHGKTIPSSLDTCDSDTLFKPDATSLRMSDMGYSNNSQSRLTICYNSLNEYINSLSTAMKTPFAAYKKIGLKKADQYLQLNTNILQIENEYYSNIRPKRIARKNETPLIALNKRGIEYIEVRCLDINPFEPLGISLNDAHFIDVFLLYCALEESPLIDLKECNATSHNLKKVIEQGRLPKLQLLSNNENISLKNWGSQLLEKMLPVANLLDKANQTTSFTHSVNIQQNKIHDSHLTPSFQILELNQPYSKETYIENMMKLSHQHFRYFQQQHITEERKKYFDQLATDSITQQKYIENSDNTSFEDYLHWYNSNNLINNENL